VEIPNLPEDEILLATEDTKFNIERTQVSLNTFTRMLIKRLPGNSVKNEYITLKCCDLFPCTRFMYTDQYGSKTVSLEINGKHEQVLENRIILF
jgi:hypothetical protein